MIWPDGKDDNEISPDSKNVKIVGNWSVNYVWISFNLIARLFRQ